MFDHDVALSNCHHYFHVDCLKKIQKNGNLFICPDCNEIRTINYRTIKFKTKEHYAEKMPRFLGKFADFSKNYQKEINTYKDKFYALEHQFIELKSEMITALGLKTDIFDKLDNIRPLNYNKRYDTYHYYLEKGVPEPEVQHHNFNFQVLNFESGKFFKSLMSF